MRSGRPIRTCLLCSVRPSGHTGAQVDNSTLTGNEEPVRGQPDTAAGRRDRRPYCRETEETAQVTASQAELTGTPSSRLPVSVKLEPDDTTHQGDHAVTEPLTEARLRSQPIGRDICTQWHPKQLQYEQRIPPQQILTLRTTAETTHHSHQQHPYKHTTANLQATAISTSTHWQV